MYVKRNYGFWMTLNWSKWPFIWGLIYSLAIFFIFSYLNIDISIPWQPLSVIGIAVAFYLGFKNNSSYDRTWEARKIWGSMVNNSRAFGAAVCSFVQGEKEEDIKRELIYRHVAWLTSLRYQLRLSREWEHKKNRIKGLYSPNVCEAYYNKMDEELECYISEKKLQHTKRKLILLHKLWLHNPNVYKN